jgi:hypothetical protein
MMRMCRSWSRHSRLGGPQRCPDHRGNGAAHQHLPGRAPRRLGQRPPAPHARHHLRQAPPRSPLMSPSRRWKCGPTGQQVVYRMAITFRGTLKVDTGKPVSKAATRELRRAQRAWTDFSTSTGRPGSGSLLHDGPPAAHHRSPPRDTHLPARLTPGRKEGGGPGGSPVRGIADPDERMRSEPLAAYAYPTLGTASDPQPGPPCGHAVHTALLGQARCSRAAGSPADGDPKTVSTVEADRLLRARTLPTSEL